jgi:hypothetical protein
MECYPPGTIWPADNFEAAQIREVYSRYGLAMYMVQVLEHGMVNAAVVMRTLATLRSHADETSWHAAFDHAYETGLARTYGNMLNQLDAIAEFPRPLLERLRAAKEDRDVLAHRFFRQHDLAFMNPNGRTVMIAWCEDRVELFKALSDEIDGFIAPIREKHGISQEWVDRAMEQSLEHARNWSPDAEPRP